MIKKGLTFLSLLCVAHMSYAISETAMLKIKNNTYGSVPFGIATVKMGKRQFRVCANKSTYCASEIYVSVEANKYLNWTVSDFTYRDHSLKIDSSCINQTTFPRPGDDLRITIKGTPSNQLNENTTIVCSS